MINKILDLVFPKKCLCCSKIIKEYNICRECNNEIIYETDLKISKIKNAKGDSIPVLELFRYEGPIVRGVHNFKFYNKPENIKYFGNYLYLHLKDYLKNENIDLITSVPMHRNKYKVRGYNQSEILAKRVATLAKIKYMNIIIKKNDHTQLHYLSAGDRQNIISKSFEVKKKIIKVNNFKSKNILLIDDVFTTGATLKECVREFNRNNIFNIHCATLTNARKVEKP